MQKPLATSFKINRAVQKIRAGEIIAYPTEAVFGLGCDPLNEEAVYRLLGLKQRRLEQGLILIASSLAQLEPYLLLTDAIIRRVQQTWPGAVTWIIPSHPYTPYWLTGKHDSLAVRVTAHPLARQLCELNAAPIVSTSANINGRPPATKAWQLAQRLGAHKLHVLAGAVGGLKRATAIYNALDGHQIR